MSEHSLKRQSTTKFTSNPTEFNGVPIGPQQTERLADFEQQLRLLKEVKDGIPGLDMHSHVRLLDTYWPSFVHLLATVPVVPHACNEQKIRKAVLEILQR
jgi:hypothetical protein